MSSENAAVIDACPDWAEYLDDRRTAVRCKTCMCVYTGRYYSEYVGKSKGGWFGGVPKKCTACEGHRTEAARKALPLDAGLVNAVKAYAAEHYDVDGWDYVVEACTDAEIWEVIAGSQSEARAIDRMRDVAGMLDERRRDVQSTAW